MGDGGRRPPMERMDEYYDALKEKLAVACMDRAPDGTCVPPKGRQCALDMNLEQIVTAVKAIRSSDMDDYAREIRNVVCEQCVNQNEHGKCEVRDALDCCVNNLMSLVVDAIEEVDERHAEGMSSTA
jgi:hypothetical protein